MSKGVKTWLIVGAALILMGCILLGGAVMAIQFDFKKISTIQYQTEHYDVTEDYKNISIETDTGDVVFLPSADGKTSVTCYERKNETHAVSVQNGTLAVEYSDLRKWYEHIGIYFGTPKITVYLPAGEYGALTLRTTTGDVEIARDFRFERMELSGSTGDVESGASVAGELKIKRSTGDITLENISADSLSLAVSTGRINATGVTCKSLSTTGDTGDLSLKDVVSSEKISVERTTGDVKLERCDAGELFIKTDTGDVKGSLLTEKVFIVRSDTGKINVPKTVAGGRCEIETDTGDITIQIKN